MMLSLNSSVISSIALWPNEVIVYHPYRGETNHLDRDASNIIVLLLDNKLHINELTDSLYQNKKNTSSLEYTEQSVHSYISELIECEIVIQC